jgi:hypothetical protein
VIPTVGDRTLPDRPATKADLDRIDRLARALDAKFRLPGTNWRFGWDGLVGLVPGVGDLLTVAPSVWMILEGRRLGVPAGVLARMAANTAVDFGLGSVPILGDLFDIAFKANLRNAALLRGAAAPRPPQGPAA